VREDGNMTGAPKILSGTPSNLREACTQMILKVRRPNPVGGAMDAMTEYLRNRFAPEILKADAEGKPEIAEALQRVLTHCLERG